MVLLSLLPYASTYGLLLLLLLLLCLGVQETIMGVKMTGSYMYKESHSLVYTQFPAAFPSLYFSWCFFLANMVFHLTNGFFLEDILFT
jgi:hypothetical protein